MYIQFLGANHIVTGSKFLLQAGDLNILLDCGLYQGNHAYAHNVKALPVAAAEIDYVLLSHAHIDHSGYIPYLIKQGFKGKVLATEPTHALCSILLPDSGYIHEEEARALSRTKDKQVKPLYSYDDGVDALSSFQPVSIGKTYSLDDNTSFYFQRASHILGACSIFIKHYETSLLYSGDLGRVHDPLLYPPAKPEACDYLIVESTYGGVNHSDESPMVALKSITNKTYQQGGKVLIPAFAVGRTQNILYYLHQLKKAGDIPDIPIYIDSPMAISATKLLYEYEKSQKLDKQETLELCQAAQYIKTFDDSLNLDKITGPAIIISASGMVQGGRVLYHIKDLAIDANNAIVFCGFQASNTLGEKISQGARSINLFGESIPMRASVYQLENISAHADQKEMLAWLSHIPHPPRKVYITHGEEAQAQGLRKAIQDTYHWPVCIPDFEMKEELV